MLRRRKLAVGGRGPVFPDSAGGWRDPSNTSRDLRNARGSAEFAWVTSHVFRRTAATELDRAGLSARQIADQLGHAKVSMTQDRYLGRRAVNSGAADALDRAHRVAKKEGGDGVSAG
jgi:integrase